MLVSKVWSFIGGIGGIGGIGIFLISRMNIFVTMVAYGYGIIYIMNMFFKNSF
jgi:hypothetical protein